MSTMPQGDGSQQRSSSQQSGGPGEWSNSGAQQGTMPGQQDFGSTPAGAVPGQQTGAFPGQQQGAVPGQQYGGQSWSGRSGSGSPVSELETHVTGRRIVQYLIDAFLVSLIPSLVSIPFDQSNRTSIHIIGGIVAFVLFVLIGIWYWVIRPTTHNGQTFGMKLLGLRVISKDGGPANMAQMFIRWICLLFDALPWTWPFTGLVGFIVILCSRHRQRIGDHLARTLVISTGTRGGQRQQYAAAGSAGTGSQPGTGPDPGMGTQSGMGMQSGMGTQSGMASGQQDAPGQQQQYGSPRNQ